MKKEECLDRICNLLNNSKTRQFMDRVLSRHFLLRKTREYGIISKGDEYRLPLDVYAPLLCNDIIDVPLIMYVLNDILRAIWRHNASFHKKLMTLPYNPFINTVKDQKNCGSLIESYLMYDFPKIPPSWDCGDRFLGIKNNQEIEIVPNTSREIEKSKAFLVKNGGKIIEVKSTLLDYRKRRANINYIRPWQTINNYYIFVIDCANENRLYLFDLTAEQMHYEVDIMNAGAMNNTKESNRINQQVPLKISLFCDHKNIDFKRWLYNYQREDTDSFVRRVTKNTSK